MKKSALILLLVSILISSSVNSTPLLNISIPDDISRERLIAGNFDIAWMDDSNAEVVGWPEDMQRLIETGLDYEVLEPDIEAFYRSRLDYELDDMGGYPEYHEIIEEMESFVEDYPEIISEFDTIGYTLENRPMIAYKISDNPNEDEDEPELFINGAIHAREVITPLIILNFTRLLCENYENDIRISNIVANNEIWIMPVVNVDGYLYNAVINPNGGGMWRKNKRIINNQLKGVDLNRNFTYNWGYDDIGSSPDPDEQTYRGSEAGSEPETQVMMDYINSREFVSCINYHSYSNVLIFPFGYDPDAYSDFHDTYYAFAEHMNETLGWITGRVYETLRYFVNGDAADWMEGGADNRIFTFIFEVGSPNDGFWPATERIDALVESQMEPLLRFCEIGGNPFLIGNPPVPTLTILDTTDNGEYVPSDTVNGDFFLVWETYEDTIGNDPVAYDVLELSGEANRDGGDGYNIPWELDGFSVTSEYYYTTANCYMSGSGPDLWNTMTADNEYVVQDDDVLTMQCRFEIEDGWDYAYVQASFNGVEYVNLEGNITTNENPHDNNLGNGITGYVTDWFQARFPLGDYSGQAMHLRFLYDTDQGVHEEGFFVDEISPVYTFGDEEIIASGFEDTVLTVDYSEVEDTVQMWYRVRSIDAQGQYSDWSEIETVVIIPVENDDAPVFKSDLPNTFIVDQPYPSPFNASAIVRVGLPETSMLEITVFNTIGRNVWKSYIGSRQPGWHTFQVDGNDWTSGIYFVVVKSRNERGEIRSAIRKAVLLK